MAKKMLIDASHPEETRVVVVDGNKVEEFDFETESRRQLAGNIYLAKVTRVEPSLQAAFVDYGGNRHGFLPFSEIHAGYYQIPVSDRQAMLAEEEELDRLQAAEAEDGGSGPSRRGRGRPRSRAAAVRSKDAVEADATAADGIPGMGVVDLNDGTDWADTAAGPDLAVEDPASGQDETDSLPERDISATDGSPANGEAEDGAGAAGNGDGDPAEGSGRIESLTEDEADEIRQPRRPRPRPYKIQEVIQVRQVLLVQVIKEERGNKGAALTTYLSLAGRYCVLMPNTARGGGISRKITNAPDRSKLKEIASNLNLPKGAGLIIRTAGAKRTKSEVKRDYEFLQRLWEQIRELTLNSTAPVQIYAEGDLIKRSIRDLYSREIDEVLVEGEAGYRTAKDFMKMIMPSHAKNVRSYQDPTPLFARHQVEGYLSSMYSPTVQLRSGGYIVVGITEALVAIDVNSGRATRQGSVEETALKTNLEAAEEIARQLRLRDLAGLIVIDFIDMDERRNNAAVEKRFKDRLRSDRARMQVGNISGFGLLEISRQRLRPGMVEATTQECAACHGTGRVRSDGSLALSILRELEEEVTRRRSREVLLKAPVDVVNFLINQKREHVAEIETRYGISIRIEADTSMISPEYIIEKLKSATRTLPRAGQVVSADAAMMPDPDELDGEDGEALDEAARSDEAQPRPRRGNRKRRRGKGGGAKAAEEPADAGDAQQDAETGAEGIAEEAMPEEPQPEGGAGGKRPGGRRRSRSRKSRSADGFSVNADALPENAENASDASDKAPDPETKPKRSRRRRGGRGTKKAESQAPGAVAEPESDAAPEHGAAPEPAPATEPDLPDRPAPVVGSPESGVSAGLHLADAPDAPAPGADVGATGISDDLEHQLEFSPGDRPDQPKSKRRGWWKQRE